MCFFVYACFSSSGCVYLNMSERTLLAEERPWRCAIGNPLHVNHNAPMVGVCALTNNKWNGCDWGGVLEAKHIEGAQISLMVRVLDWGGMQGNM